MTGTLGNAVNETLWKMPKRLATIVPEREARRFGEVRACFGALPSSAGNRIFVFESPLRDDLESAVSWLADRDVSYEVTATAPVAAEITDDLTSLDLEKSRESPGMVLESLDSVPGSDSNATISEVTDSDEREEFRNLFVDAFEASPDFPEQLTVPAALDDDSFTHLIARRDGQPVACGLLLQHGDAAGVFCVGVPPAFRRQGFGEAMIWAVLRAGRNAGSTIGVLDSSEMGYSLYEKMGFETVVEYHHFEPSS